MGGASCSALPRSSGSANGGNDSRDRSDNSSRSASLSTVVEWLFLPTSQEARRKYEDEGTLLPNCPESFLDLRLMMDEPVSQRVLGKYAIKIKESAVFMCWIDIQEYRQTPRGAYRRSKALDIYHTFVKLESTFYISFLTPADRDKYRLALDSATSSDVAASLEPDFYNQLQLECFKCIHDHIYAVFQHTSDFLQLSNRLHKKYNRVTPNDFECHSKLGEGSYGFVLHCRKKSTGIHYAMKVQRKRYMLLSYRDDPWKVSLERRAFASCQHPFIVQLAYAFQTDALAILVLELATAGDLKQVLDATQGNRMEEDRVRFYMAEVVLAVSYLHQHGFMYRDLKPQNILLREDGHIQLVDLGGSVDFEHDEVANRHLSKKLIPLHLDDKSVRDLAESPKLMPHSLRKALNGEDRQAPSKKLLDHETGSDPVASFHTLSPLAKDEAAATATAAATAAGNGLGDSPSPPPSPSSPPSPPPPLKRKYSVMGTLAYMAPEVVIMLHQTRSQRKGYTAAVDWWSLGVTMFKLLTGIRPFNDDSHANFVTIAENLQEVLDSHRNVHEYERLFREIYFPPYVSSEAVSLIKGLLNVDERLRLGAGIAAGVSEITSHPFFADINWELLELKRVEPPWKPSSDQVITNHSQNPQDFETFMVDHGKQDWLDLNLKVDDQQYFYNWDYASPHTMRVEAGLSRPMVQYNNKSKVRQVIGTVDLATASHSPAANNNSGGNGSRKSSNLLSGEPVEQILAAHSPRNKKRGFIGSLLSGNK